MQTSVRQFVFEFLLASGPLSVEAFGTDPPLNKALQSLMCRKTHTTPKTNVSGSIFGKVCSYTSVKT